MKKVALIIILVVVGLGMISPYSTYLADKGFSEKKPEKCMSGAMIKQRMFNFIGAAGVYRKVLKRFPQYKNADKAQYYLALCYEKADKSKMAIDEFEKFLSMYPNSEFVEVANKRLSNLRVNQTGGEI